MATTSLASKEPSEMRNTAGRILRSRTTTLLFVNLAVAAFLAVMQPRFLDPENLTSLVMGMTYDLLMAMGMTLILILGGIDLSVGSVLGLTGVVVTMLLSNHIMPVAVPVPLAILAGMVVAGLCGAFNGFGVAKLKIAPFIVTLSMFAIARGLATVLTSGWYVSGLPDSYLVIGQGTVLGIPLPDHHHPEHSRRLRPAAQPLETTKPGILRRSEPRCSCAFGHPRDVGHFCRLCHLQPARRPRRGLYDLAPGDGLLPVWAWVQN